MSHTPSKPIAIVTGASTGIGRGIAEKLAVEGWHVVLVARSESALRAVADSLRSRGLAADALTADVSDPLALDNLVKETLAHWGRIDVLVNNAGVDLFQPTETLTAEGIAETVATNLTGTMLLSRLVLPTMLRQGAGNIVTISSTSGLFGAAFGSVYAATKAGQIGFTRSLRSEYAKRGVKASVVCPGFAIEGGIYERLKSRIGRGTPRLVGETTTEKIASAVVRAIRSDKPEQFLNRPAYRPIYALQSLLPNLTGKLVRRTSFRFLKRVAETTESETPRVHRAA